MSYIKGEVYIEKWPSDEEGPLIALPHSCDEWVIGDVEQARQMIEDLERAIIALEAAKYDLDL